MELTNDFRVALPVERAWAVLTDLERIAPCMPGAQLQEVEGDEYRGIVKVRVGPITAQYKGQATFLERDEASHVAVLRAEGRETRGQGNANATITATLTPDGDGTAVSVVTDLTVTGRVAQFGRGVLADISAKLLGQFVESLEEMVLADESAAPATNPPDASGPAVSTGPDASSSTATTAADKSGPAVSTGPDASSTTGTTVPDASSASGTTAAATKSAAKRSPAKKPTSPAKPAAASVDVGDTRSEAAGDASTPEAAHPSLAPAESTSSLAADAPSSPAPRPAVRRIDSPEPKPVDLLDAAGSPLAKRVGPVLAAVAVLWLLKKLFSRARG